MRNIIELPFFSQCNGSGGGSGTECPIITNAVINVDGNLSVTDDSGNTIICKPMYDDNGQITALEYNGEIIPIAYNEKGDMTQIGDCIVDLTKGRWTIETPKMKCSIEPIVVIPPVILPETTAQINNSQIQCSSNATLEIV